MTVESLLLDELLEDIQVSSDWEAAREAGNVHFPEGWFGVSDAEGGYIAYFANQSDAFGFRLSLANIRLNGRDTAARYPQDNK